MSAKYHAVADRVVGPEANDWKGGTIAYVCDTVGWITQTDEGESITEAQRAMARRIAAALNADEERRGPEASAQRPASDEARYLARLRDEFAVHAPMPPPEWFSVPDHAPRPETEAALDEWDRDYRTLRLSRWPYAWADMQIAERERRNRE